MGLGGTFCPQLYDLFPWALRHLPGPHQEIFRYQEALQGFIRHEIIRHKLRIPEAPKDFISCYLTQITKVSLEALQRKQGAVFLGCTSFLCHGLSSLSLTQAPWKLTLRRHFLPIFPHAKNWLLQTGMGCKIGPG